MSKDEILHDIEFCINNKSISHYAGTIIRKLKFAYYTINTESEIGMTLESVNQRVKGLSAIELIDIKDNLKRTISKYD